MRKKRLRRFDITLTGLSFLCLMLMLISSSDPVIGAIPNQEFLVLLEQFETGNQIIFDLSVGILAGVFMYYLIVRIPEFDKRNRIRRSLEYTYKKSKEECIEIYLGCFMSSYPLELPEELCDMNHFKDFFKENAANGQNRWDAVANNLGEEGLKRLVIELELLMHEIQFTLSVVDVGDEKAFAFLKNLNKTLYRAKNWSTDYDSMKSLCAFFGHFTLAGVGLMAILHQILLPKYYPEFELARLQSGRSKLAEKPCKAG